MYPFQPSKPGKKKGKADLLCIYTYFTIYLNNIIIILSFKKTNSINVRGILIFLHD